MTEGAGLREDAPVRSMDWRLVLLGVLALVGTTILVALVNLQVSTDTDRDQALDRQAHTYEVIIRAGQLSTAAAQAESSLGRYVVSGDQRLGRQYSQRWADAADHLKRLDTLTRGDAQVQRQIAALRTAFDARGKELSETALYTVYKRDRDALGSYYKVSESPARAALLSRLDELIGHERTQLAQRKAAAAKLVANSRFTTRILAVFGLLIVLAAIVLGLMTVQALGQRAVADAEADAERDRAVALEGAVIEATAQLRDEVRERIAAEARLRQVQKMEAVGQLTGGIAHDFNNMLAVVLGGLELAKRHLHTGGPDAQRHIENAMEGANRAAALTRRLLAFSREEALLPTAVQPCQVIEGMSDLLDRTIGDAIKVTTRDSSLGWTTWADRHQLENALLNLAVNARDAMNARGALSFVTGGTTLTENEIGECAAGDYVTIAVTDTGTGMTPDVLERVFEPFFTTKPVGKGTGLGLSQIFGFVRQSGGEITIDTAPGKGTTVTLYLRRHEGEATQEGDAVQSPAPIDIDETAGEALDILVVEDDARVLRATLGALAELGHRATGCSDPAAVSATLDTMPALDLIMSDVLMPGQTGPELIAALGDRVDGVGVLFVTGFAGEADAEAFGGRPVLRKPFTMAALNRAVHEAAAARG